MEDINEKIEFIEDASDFLTEFKEYFSKVNYRKIFNNLPVEIKVQLNQLSNYYSNFFEKIDLEHSDNGYNLFLDSVDSIDNLNVDINIYTTSYNKMGLHVSLKNNDSINPDYEILQHIYFVDVPFDDKHEMKKYLYNLLFYAYIICHDFSFNPLLMYLYHKNDIDKLVEMRKRNINLFSTVRNCSVCLEQTITKTPCKHYICQCCYSSLVVKKCPLCREII
jgi:hypothetical protein